MRLAQEITERGGVGRLAQARGEVLVAQAPADGRQSGKLLAPSRRRNQHQKYEIDRFAVGRIERDRLVQPGEQAERLLKLLDSGMRQRETFAKPGRSEIFSGHEGGLDCQRIEVDEGCRAR